MWSRGDIGDSLEGPHRRVYPGLALIDGGNSLLLLDWNYVYRIARCANGDVRESVAVMAWVVSDTTIWHHNFIS